MRLTKTLLISAVLLMSATGMQAAAFNQNGNYLTRLLLKLNWNSRRKKSLVSLKKDRYWKVLLKISHLTVYSSTWAA